MVPTYENRPEDLDVYENRTLTFPPHLHEGVELFYVESGAITVTCAGCTRTLYPGWMAVIFPNAIHSYLTDPCEKNGHFLFAICHPRLAGEALRTLTHFEPEDPFLPPDAVHPDMVYAPVSYTHLDVYKRQGSTWAAAMAKGRAGPQMN